MRASPAALILATLLAGQAWGQAADRAFAERQLAVEFNTRCGFFTDEEFTALEASRLQARNALLRAGWSVDQIQTIAQSAVFNARESGCASALAADVQGRVSNAYMGWSVLSEMSFPGQIFDWDANRNVLPDTALWSARQDAEDLIVGLVKSGDRARLTIALPAITSNASSVALIVRDTRRAPDLYDPTVGGAFPGPAEAPWARWVPPDYARQIVFASARLGEAEAYDLTGDGSRSVYQFSDRAAEALAGLDPREAARIDVLDRTGTRLYSRYFEVGDFVAVKAFVDTQRNLSARVSASSEAP